MRGASRAHAARAAAAALALVLITCAYTWPLPARIASGLPHGSGDPLLVTWILWWTTKAVPLTAAWWNAPAFYPAAGVFAFSETLLGLAPITAPIILLAHSPIAAYNIAFLCSFVLSGLAAYALGLVLTRSHGAAFVCAVAYAFPVYRLSHLQHLQLLSSYWMPAALAALHRFHETGRARWAAASAAGWLMQSLACGYYFFYLPVLAALWIAWYGRRWSRRRLVVLAAWWIVAAIAILPLLLGYKRIQDAYGFRRVPSEIAYYSADIAGLASASPDSLVWHGLHSVDRPESEIFPGLTLTLLAIAGVAMARRRRARDIAFYAGAAVVVWLLALGPRPELHGHALGVPGPYAALMALPGFNGVRVPARFWMLAILCLSAVAALTVSRIDGMRRRRVAVAICTVLLLVEGWPREFPVVAAPQMRVTPVANAVARLGLPLRGNETETMYGAIAQARPVFNGYSGYDAPQHPALGDLLDSHDDRILDRLAAAGPIEILVEKTLDPDGSWRRWVSAHAGVRLVAEDGSRSVYVLRTTDAAAPPPPAGTPLLVREVDASDNAHDIDAVLDGDPVTRWHAPQQLGHESVDVGLDRPASPRWLVLSLGTYASQFPRRLVVSGSADGQEWKPCWQGSPALAVYDAAVRAPRRVPVSLPLSCGATVRFLRLEQTATDPRPWTITDLQVLQ